jgi:predicted choloylglycine hydrolase
MILDQCSTTAEAVERLRQLPHAMQYNYSLLDANGVASVVEAGAGAVAARRGAWLACTNHFQSALLRPLNRWCEAYRFLANSHGKMPATWIGLVP